MSHLSRTMVALGVTFVVALVATMACGARSGDYEEDFTEMVERVCADYCSMNLACREPAAFESKEDCEDICLGYAYIYNDTTCGQSKRDMFECIGSQPTCDLFNNTYDVHADDYTCKTEKDYDTSLDCGQSDEDPFSQGAP